MSKFYCFFVGFGHSFLWMVSLILPLLKSFCDKFDLCIYYLCYSTRL